MNTGEPCPVAAILLRGIVEGTMVDSAFWRAQAERFDKLHDATYFRGRPLSASFNPNGWGLRDVRAFQHCVDDRWLIGDGAPSTIDEFKSVAGVCAVALGCPNVDNAWANWLDYLRRESVDFEPGFTVTSYAPDARPDADAEMISTTLGKIEDVCGASTRFCRKLADESQKAELTEKAARRRFPNRAAWLKREMAEREHMTPHRVSVLDGPDKKTTARILRGEHVLPHVLDKLAKALSVLRVQIPDD